MGDGGTKAPPYGVGDQPTWNIGIEKEKDPVD